MAQEVQKEKTKFKSLVKVLLGVLIILIGIGLTMRFFWALRVLVAGSLGPLLILVGLIVVAIARE